MQIWSVAEKRKLHELEPRPEDRKDYRGALFSCPVFTPDGQTVMAAGRGGKLRAWDVKTGTSLRSLTPSGGDIHTISLTPDGHWVVLAGRSQLNPGDQPTLRVIERATGQVVRAWSPQPYETTAASVSPCGRFVATCGHINASTVTFPSRPSDWSDDKVVRVWNLFTGAEVAAFAGHRGPVNCVAWSPDGKMLASGSDDATVLVWDTSKLAFKLPQPPKPDRPEKWWDQLLGSAKVSADLTLEMLAHPADAVKVLGPRLLATSKFDEKAVAALIKDVTEGDFQPRTAAARALGEYDIEAVAPQLRAARTDGVQADVRAELSRLLGEAPGFHTQHVRRLRAVRALELIGTEEARKVLADLAKRTDAPAIAREAELALKRLAPPPRTAKP